LSDQKLTQKHQRAVAFAILIACALAGIVACSTSRRDATPARATPPTREVTDEAGRRLSVPSRPERIITLAPNLTEIVYAVGAGHRLVGNTTYCDYPQEAQQVSKVGDTLQPNIERIIALKPDLILISTASQLEAFTTQLNERNISVYVTDPRDLEAVFRSIERLGDVLDERERAAKVAGNLRARSLAVEEKVKTRDPLKVFYQVSAEPLYTAGRDSFITDLISRAGGKSVTAEVAGAWPRYSNEAALATQPEAIVMPTGDSMGAAANAEVNAALKNSPAVREGRVYRINGDLLSRPGPRLVEGLEQLARALHPEAFG
jgi:iron complex transport system substrate-binding protein